MVCRFEGSKRSGGGTLIALAAALLLAGCVTPSPNPPSADWPQAQDATVLLQPGDLLRIKFAYWPELDDEQTIRPDGKIALQFVGDVMAQGLSPEQLRDQLLALYAVELKDPKITVVVRGFDARRVYVGGEVKTPGVVPMHGRLTLLQAIMQAGGFNEKTAKPSGVIVVRHRDGKQFACAVDVRKALAQPSSDQFALEPLDVVYVPRTAIDKLDQWVDQHINQIIPRNLYTTFTLTHSMDSQPASVTQTGTNQTQITLP